jgi:hypothetical protein
MENLKISTANLSQENIQTLDSERQSSGSSARGGKDQDSCVARFSDRAVFITNMDLKITRADILDSLENSGLNQLIEIFIFKVDSNGQPKGKCNIICKSHGDVQHLLSGLHKVKLGSQVVTEICIDHSEEMEQKLSKERQMELNKVQRKYKKLLKFPKTCSKESFQEVLSSVRTTKINSSNEANFCFNSSSDKSLDLNKVRSCQNERSNENYNLNLVFNKQQQACASHNKELVPNPKQVQKTHNYGGFALAKFGQSYDHYQNMTSYLNLNFQNFQRIQPY